MHQDIFRAARFGIRLAALSLALATGLTAQAAPVALSISGGSSLQPYQGSVTLNAGLVDVNNVLYYVKEAQVGRLQSWYLVFDPMNRQRIRSVVDFGAPIHSVITDFAGLLLSQALFAVDLNGDGQRNDYEHKSAFGLERSDQVSWIAGDSRLLIDWYASDPGDHARVLVLAAPQVGQLPEPGTLALAGAALFALARARRRRA